MEEHKYIISPIKRGQYSMHVTFRYVQRTGVAPTPPPRPAFRSAVRNLGNRLI